MLKINIQTLDLQVAKWMDHYVINNPQILGLTLNGESISDRFALVIDPKNTDTVQYIKRDTLDLNYTVEKRYGLEVATDVSNLVRALSLVESNITRLITNRKYFGMKLAFTNIRYTPERYIPHLDSDFESYDLNAYRSVIRDGFECSVRRTLAGHVDIDYALDMLTALKTMSKIGGGNLIVSVLEMDELALTMAVIDAHTYSYVKQTSTLNTDDAIIAYLRFLSNCKINVLNEKEIRKYHNLTKD